MTTAWVAFGLLLVAAYGDLRWRVIPRWVPVLLAVWCVVAEVLGLRGGPWWSPLAGGVLGGLLGLALLALGGIRSADAVLLALLGVALGVTAILWVLLLTALAGAAVALATVARGRQDLPFTPAMALGLFAYLVWQTARWLTGGSP